MKIYADYHTHTIYSHGVGTIKENVEEAIRKGLKEISISDHGFGHVLFGVKRNKLSKMREEIDEMNQSTNQIKVLLGMEANIVSKDGKIDLNKEEIKKLDIVLAGIHLGAFSNKWGESVEMNIRTGLTRFLHIGRKKTMIMNTDAVVAAIYNNDIDILTHPGSKADLDIKEVARAAAQRGTALEINSSHHGHLTVKNIKIAMKEGAKFVIGSDAHRPENVGNVSFGIERALKAGLSVDQIINAEK